MVSKAKINVPRERISLFCREHRIHGLALLSDRFGDESDVDVLVEFEPGQIVGLIRMAGIERELGEILGRQVDIRTPADLSRYFRDDVLASAEVQYAGG
jgi:predicted nucleotidyltransferase